MIWRNHFSMSKSSYEKGLLTGLYNRKSHDLDIKAVIENKFEVFMGCINLVDPVLEWDHHDKIKDKSAVRQKLENGSTNLKLLIDEMRKPVGFTVITPPSTETLERFYSKDDRVIEFDYLAMFEGEEGKGRGKKYFQMLFDEYFDQYDHVYWSQHSTNAPTLGAFYREKMGMEHLAKDDIQDFRIGKGPG